ESGERNIQSQIESNERSLQRQIATKKETTLIEFKATINTQNRQNWINELRQTLTEYLSNTTLIYPFDNKLFELMLIENEYQINKMSLAKAKLELLMNHEKPEQKKLLDEVEDMLKVVNDPQRNIKDIIKSRSKVIFAARHLFEIHWKKIKELQ